MKRPARIAALLVALCSLSLDALLAADLGVGFPAVPVRTRELHSSPVYSPRNGYSGDLSLLANNPNHRVLIGADASAALTDLKARVQKAREEEAEVRRKLAETEAREVALRTRVAEMETQLRALAAEREALRAREKELGGWLDRILVSPERPRLTPEAPPSSRP